MSDALLDFPGLSYYNSKLKTFVRSEIEEATGDGGNIADFAVGYVYGERATAIPGYAFAANSSATGITTSAYNMNTLRYVNYPNVLTVGAHAFDNAIELDELHLEKARTAGASAFYYARLRICDMPNLYSAGSHAFAAAFSFDVENINLAAYSSDVITQSMPKLQMLRLGTRTAGLSFSTSHASYFASLSYVEFPLADRVSSYGFRALPMLETAIIPKVSDNMGYDGFYGCSKLSVLSLGETTAVPILGGTALNGTKLHSGIGSIYVPASLYDSFATATNWASYSARMVSV